MYRRFYFSMVLTLILQLLCCTVGIVCGQEQISKSLLWEISNAHTNQKSYLYGTIHVQDQRVFAFGDSVMICFEHCQQYAGEIVVDNIDAKTLAPQLLLPKGQSLKGLIGKSYFKKIKIHLRQHRMGRYGLVVNKIKPFMVIALLSQANLPKENSLILDDYLQQLARKKKMQVVGLESVAEQMDAVNKIPLEKQATMLKLTIDSLSNTKQDKDKGYEEMLKIYLDQDIEQLQAFAESDDDDGLSTEFVNHILLERNNRMAERVIGLIQSKKTFVGVGAAHLAGKEGIIALLKSKGYTLRPITAAFLTK